MILIKCCIVLGMDFFQRIRPSRIERGPSLQWRHPESHIWVRIWEIRSKEAEPVGGALGRLMLSCCPICGIPSFQAGSRLICLCQLGLRHRPVPGLS